MHSTPDADGAEKPEAKDTAKPAPKKAKPATDEDEPGMVIGREITRSLFGTARRRRR